MTVYNYRSSLRIIKKTLLTLSVFRTSNWIAQLLIACYCCYRSSDMTFLVQNKSRNNTCRHRADCTFVRNVYRILNAIWIWALSKSKPRTWQKWLNGSTAHCVLCNPHLTTSVNGNWKHVLQPTIFAIEDVVCVSRSMVLFQLTTSVSSVIGGTCSLSFLQLVVKSVTVQLLWLYCFTIWQFPHSPASISSSRFFLSL